ncbi:Hemicentin-2 [Holothuria leucospilota]|uniref:Hemicentin-2 n=1 Tax=Holothuria leucospilota TaxID=206669 RepID=A0A9Q1CLP6_HOLLE|nr:Hemicentin-2 [Holothuria leucospilota]
MIFSMFNEKFILFLLHFIHLPGDNVRAEQAIAMVHNYADLACIFNASQFGVLRNVVWKKEEENILRQDWSKLEKRKNNYTATISYEKTSASLRIRYVQFKDAGNYSCSAYFDSGVPVTTVWILQIQGYPLLSTTKNVLTENDTIMLKCCVDFALKPHGFNFVWSFTGASVSSNTEPYTRNTFAEGKHTICSYFPIKVNRDYHQAVLECLIHNELNATTAFKFNVTYPPTVDMYYKSSFKLQNLFLVNKGDDTNITCTSKGNPEPKVSLEKEIKLRKTTEWMNQATVPVIHSGETGTFVTSFLIQNVSAESVGVFRCKAFNGVGETAVSGEISLQITDPVTVQIVKPEAHETGHHGKLNISCVAEGYPMPKVKLQKIVNNNEWVTLPKKPVIASDTFTLNVTFVFSASDQDVYGTYRCFADNIVGSNATSDQITIEIPVSLSFFIGVLRTMYIPITVSIVSIFLILLLVIVIRKALKGICCFVYNVSTDTKRQPKDQRMSALDEFWRGLSYEYDITPNDEKGVTSENSTESGLQRNRANNYVDT